MVASKAGKEAVFTMPGYSKGQIQRYLMFLGWEYVAGVECGSAEDAMSIPDDINILKLKGAESAGRG